MLPIRCFTCGKVISNLWDKYKSQIECGISASNVFVTIGITRYCCKRMFLGHVELTDKLLLYSTNNNNDTDKKYEK